MSDDLVKALRRIAKISYGATIDEARSVSKVQRDAADLIEQHSRDLAALREDIEAQIRIASEEAARADSFGRDAARYRWIRNGHICMGRQSTLLMTGGALDDAIDAAISKEKEQTS